VIAVEGAANFLPLITERGVQQFINRLHMIRGLATAIPPDRPICEGAGSMSRKMRIAGQLLILFRYAGSRPPDLHIGTV
jgi:hypothetical protein